MRSSRSLALALAPGTLLAGIAGGIVFPIFPIVGKEIGLSAAFIGLILAANRAMRVVCSSSIGVMTDRIGAKRTLLIGLALQIGVIALYLLGFATHHEGAAFLAGRILHGPGSACVFIAASTLALQANDGANGGATAATVRAAIVLGVPIGFAIGGLTAEVVGNVGTFTIALAAVCVALVIASITVPDLRAPTTRRPRLREALAELRDKRLLGIGGINFALNFAASGMVLSTLAFIVESRHLSVFGRDARGTSGLLMAILSITDASFTTYAGRYGDRHRAHGKVAAGSLVVVALGLVAIALTGGELGVACGIALIGLGAGGLGPSVLVMVGAVVPPDRRGTGAGLLQLCGDAGGMLGPFVGTAIFANSSTLPYLLTAGLVACFVPIALWLARTINV